MTTRIFIYFFEFHSKSVPKTIGNRIDKSFGKAADADGSDDQKKGRKLSLDIR